MRLQAPTAQHFTCLAQWLFSAAEQKHDRAGWQTVGAASHQVACKLHHHTNVAGVIASTCSGFGYLAEHGREGFTGLVFQLLGDQAIAPLHSSHAGAFTTDITNTTSCTG
eukprot:GHRQ01037380.1.p3 GENE.GHRQ01037380.1~~GHRQ01037380.1.p3  ORF type:complete len:110 (+),score=18.06 GHRQ01037380.1:42-371(+)